MKLLLKGARQILQVVDDGRPFLAGEAMKKIAILEAASDGSLQNNGLSIVVDK